MVCDTQFTRQDCVEKELSSAGSSGLVWSFLGLESPTLLTTVEEGALVAETTAAVCCQFYDNLTQVRALRKQES